MNDVAKPLRGSRVHILGVAYKRNIDDMRESPALDVMHLLRERGAVISYSDPFVPSLNVAGSAYESVPVETAVRNADCVVIITDHSDVDYAQILDQAKLIVDTRNALKKFDSPKIVRL